MCPPAVRPRLTGCAGFTTVEPTFSTPTGIAIAPNGSIFAADSGSSNILKLTSGGVQSWYTGNLNAPIGISIDHATDLFSIDNNSSLLSEINGSTGVSAPKSPYAVSISNASVAAVDGVGSIWIANYVGNFQGNVLHVSAAGAIVGSGNGLHDASLVGSAAGAIDGAGNFWVTNPGNRKITEFLSIAAPVVTPIAVASATNTLDTRP